MARGLKLCIKEVEGLYYPYSENKGADQLRSNCAFVFTYAKSRVSHDALKLNILQATNINVFCTSQYYKYIYARLTSSLVQCLSFQCLVHYLFQHGSTKELKVIPLYRVERLFGVIDLSLDKITSFD